MAREFSTKEARWLSEQHISLKEELKAAAMSADFRRDRVRTAAQEMVAENALRLLKDIPVDELNRGRRGIRIKSLRDNGFSSMADIYTASVEELAAVNGISDDGAWVIRNIAQDIYFQAAAGAKIRLSADDRSHAATELVRAVSIYRRISEPSSACSKLLAYNQSSVDYSLGMLAPALNGLKWFFSSRADKQAASDAYHRLFELLQDNYGIPAQQLLYEIESIERTGDDEAWDDFADNSIRFFNILEEIVPELLGSDDSVYGLPEELAGSVQSETFSKEGLRCELRRYQEWGVKYILHQGRVLLGDEMGLGKTVQAIAAMVSLRNAGAKHFIVVCPASVVSNWCREIAKHSDLSVIKVHGAARLLAVRRWLADGGVAVTTYETTSYFNFPENFTYAMLTVDEAHYIKNPAAQRSINVRRLALKADRLLFMTGTALENRVDEMVELISVLNPEVAQQVRGIESLSHAEVFRQAVAPVYYRRKRDDVLKELPELIESKEWCILGAEETKTYESSAMRGSFNDMRRVSWNVEKPLENSSKAHRLIELIEEAESDGRKVIVFSFFLDTLRTVRDILGSRCMPPINGSVSPVKRQEIIDEFEKAPAGSVLTAQIQSGGTGLNIQSASVVIICEPQLKPSIENQAISRAYRMGQTRNVLVYRLLCDDTIDEKITDLLYSKQQTFDAFADKSVAAENDVEIDEKSFGEIVREEIERINKKCAE